MAISGEAKKAEAQKDAGKAKLLEAFWKLAEFNSKVRADGIKQINDYLKQLNEKISEDDLSYILMRLIRGLASNRKCARLGFSCALTHILTHYKFIKFESVIKTADKELIPDQQQQQAQSQHILTNEEIRNVHIGNAFVYLCLIQSNRSDELTEHAESIIEKLNKKRKSVNKTYIQQLYLDTMVLFIRKLSNEKLFEKQILPKFADELKIGWNAANKQESKDALQLLLACLNTYPSVTEKFVNIEQHWLNKNLLAANEDKLYEFISTCSESLPKLHSFCEELCSYALKLCNLKQFESFWSTFIEQRLCAKKDLEKKCLSYNIWLYCVQNSPATDLKYAKVLLSKNVCSSFVNHYLHPNTNLHVIVQQLCKQLVKILEGKERTCSDSITCEFALNFIGLVPNLHELSDLVASFILIMNANGLNKIFRQLVELLNSPPVLEASESEEETIIQAEQLKNRQIWLVNQLSSFSKNQILCENLDSLKNVLEFFLVNSYFESTGASGNDLKLISNKTKAVDENLKDILFKYIGLLITKTDLNLNKVIFERYKHIEKLFNDLKSTGASKCKLNEKYSKKMNDYKQLWSRIVKLMEKFLAKTTKNEDYLMHAFFMILTFEALRMFDSYQDSLGVIEDLEIAFEKSQTKKKVSTSVEDEPEWIEIVVEMLLSLYAINNRWIRNGVAVLFKKLIPILTPNAVKLIIDLLEPEAEDELMMENDEDDDDGELFSNEEEESGIEDDKVEESEESSSSGEEKPKKTNGHANGKATGSESDETDEPEVENDDNDDSDDEEEDEDNDEEDGKDVDEELKKAVDAALGAGAARNSEDSDLDDEAMFKLDEALSAAFKMKKKIRKHETDVIQYRSKVLDLIHEVFKSTQRLDLIVYSIEPMLNVLFESQTKSNLKAISQRIVALFINFKNIRKLNDSKMPEIDELFQILSNVIACSVKHFNATNILVEISIFCVRLIQHIANQENKDRSAIQQRLTDVYSTLIKNFYTKNDTKVNQAIHKEYLIRFPAVSLPLAEQMIECSSVKDVKLHKKTITLVTLNQVINNQMFSTLDQKNVKSFMAKIFKFFNLLIDEIIEDESVHVKFVDASLNLINRVLNLTATLIDKSLVEDLSNKLLTFNKETKFKQAYKSKCQNLLNLCKSKFGAKLTDSENTNDSQNKKAKKHKLNNSTDEVKTNNGNNKVAKTEEAETTTNDDSITKKKLKNKKK